MDAVYVTLAALGTALATGLGALPLLLRRRTTERALGIADAAAAGFMLAASVGLAIEGIERGVVRSLGGAALGAVFIALTQRLLHGRKEGHLHMGQLQGVDAIKAVTIVTVMTVHSLAEGVGVGVSFGGEAALGVFITIAIAVHNIPEGLAISLVLVPRGASVRSAAWWSVFSSLPQPLLALPAFLFVETFQSVLPAGLGFAAGAMIWMVVSELLPDASSRLPARALASALALSFTAMMALQIVLLDF